MKSVLRCLVVVAMPLAASVCANAEEVATSASGAEVYQQYCALCHGIDGRGLGPVTEKTTRPAADLTQIAKRNGGQFSASAVSKKIVEGGGIAEHAASRMPAWGKLFAAGADPERAGATVAAVTTYIAGLQEK